MNEQQNADLKKIKIMLLVEYLLFAAIFLVLGILFLTDIIKVAEWKRYVFTYVTLAGGLWIIADFFWCVFSPKRRAKNSMVDKSLVLPVGFVLLAFDIYALTQGCAETLPYRYFIGGDLCYLGACYIFESVYHWYRPIPAVIEAALADEEKKKSEQAGPDNPQERS